MKNTIEKLDKLPDAALSQLSEPAKASELSNNIENPGVGEVDKNEVLQGGKHTTLEGLPGLDSQPGMQQGQGEETGAKAPVITQAAGASQPVAIGTLLNGKLGIEIVDMLFPAILVLAVGLLDYEVSKKDLQLTAQEKATVAPFMQAYLDSVNVQMSPLGALAAVLSGIYVVKFMEVIPNIKKKAKTKQPGAAAIQMKPDKNQPITLSPEETMKRINKMKDVVERRKQYALFVAPMAYDVAIAHIRATRRMNEKESKVWYERNVKPIKDKK